jgi:hypothetical protein
MARYPQYIAPDNALDFLSDDGGATYNLCHFWSNFEIADMELWRSEAYTAFFDYLDQKGGFYYEVCMSSVRAGRRADTRQLALGRCARAFDRRRALYEQARSPLFP